MHLLFIFLILLNICHACYVMGLVSILLNLNDIIIRIISNCYCDYKMMKICYEMIQGLMCTFNY